MHRMMSLVAVMTIAITFVAGCSTAPKSAEDRAQLLRNADATMERFTQRDPSIEDRVDEARGYVVFPSVGKGGAGLGGAYGRGVVYEAGDPIGFASLTQGTLGLQLGGQSYSELILFEDEYALGTFRDGKFAFSAQASAIAATAGAAATADYENGVMVFTLPKGGLMAEASVGGQKFGFEPIDEVAAGSR